MAEQLDLATPYGTQTPMWRVLSLHLERGFTPGVGFVPENSFIEVILVGDNSHRFAHRWIGTIADGLIIALNKANLTTQSLQYRVLQRLVADGVFPGTVSGTVD